MTLAQRTFSNVHSVMLPIDYNVSFADLVKAGNYDEVGLPINEETFPVEVLESEERRQFHIVMAQKVLGDHENPTQSELLLELDREGYRPEGAFALCTVGRCFPRLQRLWSFGARKQLCRSPEGGLVYPALHTFCQESEEDEAQGPRGIIPWKVGIVRLYSCFLVSLKPGYVPNE